jgi:N-acetylglucosamine kinase-like BadF-type ATPase
MSLFLGIDGGGTKTKINVIDEFGKLIFENTSGPSSIDTVDRDTTFNSIFSALEPLLSENKNLVFDSVFCGLGGIVFEEDCQDIENLLHNLNCVSDTTLVKARNDMENALYSGLNFDSGITLICGTGMVAFGKNHGNTHKCGGWGFKEGELGSGYNLGREAIRHCIRAFDNRYPLDDFAVDVAEVIGLTRATDIIEISNRYFNNRTLTAELAPLVTKHADLENEYAKLICDMATYELLIAVKGVYDILDLEETTLVIVGSLGNSQGYFGTRLREKINQVMPNVNIISPQVDPAYAASLMAKKMFEDLNNGN